MDVIDVALSKSYTDVTVEGGGAVQGKNCTISSIAEITGGHRVTFSWTLDDGTAETSTLDVMDGTSGVGITSIEIDDNNHLIITDTDGNEMDAGAIYNGTTASDFGALALTGGDLSGNLTIAKANSGTANTDSILYLGNNTPAGETGCTRGYVRMFAKNGKYTNLIPSEATVERNYLLPKDKANNSVLAVISDIPTSTSDLSDGPCLSKASGGKVSGNLTVNLENGTSSKIGESIIAIGNSTPKGTSKNSKGTLRIWSTGDNKVEITTDDSEITDNRTLKLPDKSGTIACTSDIPSVKSLSFARKDFTFPNTVATQTEITIDITYSGWTPIGIVNTYTNNYMTAIDRWNLSGDTQAKIRLCTTASGVTQIQYASGRIQVLYYKYQ